MTYFSGHMHFKWNGWTDAKNAQDSMARRQKQKEMVNTIPWHVRVALPCLSESNGSNLPCVATENISALQSKRFFKCV